MSIADDPSQPVENRLVQSNQTPAADSTAKTDREDKLKTSGGDDQVRTKISRTLTIQHKRIFVLGLGASQKN